MPCDVQVWDEWDFQIIFSCRGTQPIYIQGNTWLSCIKVFRVHFGPQMLWKGCGHSWD